MPEGACGPRRSNNQVPGKTWQASLTPPKLAGFCLSHAVQALNLAGFCYSHAVQALKLAGFCSAHAVQAPKGARGAGQVCRIQEN